jgi:hypothetical protein
MRIVNILKAIFFNGFDPFDLCQMEPPKKFRSGKFKVKLEDAMPFVGLRMSMDRLGKSLWRGLDQYKQDEHEHSEK